MTKILVTDGMAADGQSILKAEPSIELTVRKETPASELLGMIHQYDCLVVRSATKVTREVIEKGTNLKLICRAGAGVDNVDVAAATERKIAVMNTASANSLAAAEHTIAMLFAMLRQIPAAEQSVRAQKWERTFAGYEATGKTLGVLGLGNIGRIVADRAIGLKMNVIGFDPLVKELPQVKVESSIEAVLKSADIVTLHLPVVAQTKNILNRERLSLMKPGSWLINCARGGLVDEDALCDLLDQDKIRGAAFDVYKQEPIVFPNRLAAHPKIVVTPHLGASTVEAQNRVGITASQQIIGFFTRQDRTGVLN